MANLSETDLKNFTVWVNGEPFNEVEASGTNLKDLSLWFNGEPYIIINASGAANFMFFMPM